MYLELFKANIDNFPETSRLAISLSYRTFSCSNDMAAGIETKSVVLTREERAFTISLPTDATIEQDGCV